MGRIQEYFRRVVGAPDSNTASAAVSSGTASAPAAAVPDDGAPARRVPADPGDLTVPAAMAYTSGARGGEVRRRIESHGMSHVGKVRQTNEDHFVVASLQRSVQVRQTNLEDPAIFDRLCGPKAYLFAVADGVGGRSDGQLASGMAVETIVEYLGETVASYHGAGAIEERDFLEPLRHAVQRAHDRLLSTFRLQGHGGPATTLTIALLVWPRAFIVHVGDSRAYHRHDAELRRLTRDQTIGALMVDEHGMSEEQVQQAGLDNVLASALGAEDMTPAVEVIELAPGDALLLCTDGLTRHVSEERIAAVLHGATDAEASCRELVELALEEGGRDNITAIVARMLPG
ncbi:MAG TPA: protein phosphatase 2C domain-containing protein [Gemmatimonadaceae bacterium]|nr:protein phosphatase 2C domain-containing protein [Gemmatimonadaceae bacterium]